MLQSSGALSTRMIGRNKGGLHQMTDSEVGSYKAGVRISRYLFDENMSVCVCSSLLSDGVNGVNENDAPSLCNKMEIGQSSVLLAARSDSNVRGGGLIGLVGQPGNSIRAPLSSTQGCCWLTSSSPHSLCSGSLF